MNFRASKALVQSLVEERTAKDNEIGLTDSEESEPLPHVDEEIT